MKKENSYFARVDWPRERQPAAIKAMIKIHAKGKKNEVAARLTSWRDGHKDKNGKRYPPQCYSIVPNATRAGLKRLDPLIEQYIDEQVDALLKFLERQ